jgi:hypothetical protein
LKFKLWEEIYQQLVMIELKLMFKIKALEDIWSTSQWLGQETTQLQFNLKINHMVHSISPLKPHNVDQMKFIVKIPKNVHLDLITIAYSQNMKIAGATKLH